jgi:ABC-type phosphate/phosphonate transport system substrate-binding protein
LLLGLTASLVFLQTMKSQWDEIDARQALLFDEAYRGVLQQWNYPGTTEVTIESRHLHLLDGRSPAFESRARQLTLGVLIRDDPISYTQRRAKQIVEMEAKLGQALGEPVLLHLKIFKEECRHAGLIGGGGADFMLLEPVAYLQAKQAQPGIVLLARESKAPAGVIITREKSGVSDLRQLAGRSFAFLDPADALSVIAKAHLANAGLCHNDLSSITYFSDRDAPSSLSEIRPDRKTSRRQTLSAVLDGEAAAAVTTLKRFELNRHLGLIKLHDIPANHKVFVAREGLDPKVIQSFRAALLDMGRVQSKAADDFPDQPDFLPAVGCDDLYLDALRDAFQKAERFDHPES